MNAENTPDGRNLLVEVVEGFGDEWERYDQSALSETELRQAFDGYFGIFPWTALPAAAEGFDMGCGSGRWAKLVAPKVGRLNCVDPSPKALSVAQRNLSGHSNCEYFCASVEESPLADGSQDFGYCLGVLHHVPDTAAGLRSCVAKLKEGAPFLLYLYYAFDHRPRWFKLLWQCSNVLRVVVSRLPHRARFVVANAITALVYWPLARTAALAERFGISVSNFPLSYYRHRSFYTLRTDALDRFGTRLEKRFTREQIERMMKEAGLEMIRFSDAPPYWCAVGNRVRSMPEQRP
jgi:SAM-dependent methyltransferase